MDKGFITYVKGHGRLWRPVLLVAVGVFLILISSFRADGDEGRKEITLDEYRVRLEGEVAELCSSVSGVGGCNVFITFERGEQSVYKGSAVIETKPPRVLGVTVVCRGGESDKVKRELTEMLSALFDIGSNRIAVLKLNS